MVHICTTSRVFANMCWWFVFLSLTACVLSSPWQPRPDRLLRSGENGTRKFSCRQTRRLIFIGCTTWTTSLSQSLHLIYIKSRVGIISSDAEACAAAANRWATVCDWWESLHREATPPTWLTQKFNSKMTNSYITVCTSAPPSGRLRHRNWKKKKN